MDLDPAEALANVYRDPVPDPEAVDWAADELLAGRDLSHLVSELIERGWDSAAAETAVEVARVRTRRDRGVLTRADVVGDLHARHRQTSAGMAAFYRSSIGPFSIFSFVTGLRSALGAFRRLRRLGRGTTPTDP